MSKKYMSLIALFIIGVCLTGCTEVMDLTDTETILISEYAADLLLKYDVNHNDRIYSGEKAEQEMIEEAEEDFMNGVTPTTEASTEEDGTEEPTTEATTEAEENNNGRNLNSNIDEQEEDTTEESPAALQSGSDIASIIGLDGVSITYKDYLVTDHYPATDSDGEFIYLEATEGYQLLVLRFNITNTSSDSVNISMLDKSVDYKLVCNGKNAANPMLTILLNDLETMQAVINPEDSEEGVLVFQVSNDMKDRLESMDLKLNYNDTESVINIL